jgi:hypothetical protein
MNINELDKYPLCKEIILEKYSSELNNNYITPNEIKLTNEFLYKIFDNSKLFINIFQIEFNDETKWQFVINRKYTLEDEMFNSRVEAESMAFIQCFKILEQIFNNLINEYPKDVLMKNI